MHSSNDSINIVLDVVGVHSNDVELVMREVLDLQSLLIVNSLTDTNLQTNAREHGFLSLQISYQELMQRLVEGCKILTARHQGTLVGYVLLAEPDRFFTWIRKACKLEMFNQLQQLSVDEMEHAYKTSQVKVLTQIAVTPSFKKHGIGRQLVDYAKQLAPTGLLTTIAYKPIANHASLAFFSRQGFLVIAKASFIRSPESSDSRSALDKIYIEFWEKNN